MILRTTADETTIFPSWAITPPHRGGLPPEITAIISEMIFAPEHGVEEEECMSQARLSVPEKEPDNPFRSSLNESLQVSLEDIHAPSPDIIEPETTSFVPRFQQFTSRLKQESFQESLPISGKSSRKRKAVLEQEDLGEPSIEQRFTYECDKGRPDGDTRPLKRTRSCDGLWNPQWHAKRQKTPQGGEINGLFPAAAFSRFKFKKAVRLATSHSNPKEGSDNEDDANDDIRPYSDSLNSSSDEDLPFDTTQLLNGLLA